MWKFQLKQQPKTGSGCNCTIAWMDVHVQLIWYFPWMINPSSNLADYMVSEVTAGTNRISSRKRDWTPTLRNLTHDSYMSNFSFSNVLFPWRESFLKQIWAPFFLNPSSTMDLTCLFFSIAGWQCLTTTVDQTAHLFSTAYDCRSEVWNPSAQEKRLVLFCVIIAMFFYFYLLLLFTRHKTHTKYKHKSKQNKSQVHMPGIKKVYK